MFFVMKISKLCNLRCTYCYEYEELANKERMPLDRLAYFFENLATHYLTEGWTDELRFVLHGGEPLLLPDTYLREFVALQRQYLTGRGVPYRNSLQTNLYRIDPDKVGLLEELEISLGVSLDVFGAQRITAAGDDTQDRVIDNLQMLFDTGAIDRLQVGMISVLHRQNIANAVQTFQFYDRLGLSYRILPIFSMTEPPDRVRHLTLRPAQVVDALKQVALAQFSAEGGGNDITVFPLWNYFQAAIHHVTGVPEEPYDPRLREWALIVNTNGDAYNHSEAYTPEGLMGNIFAQPIHEILVSEGRRRTLELRMDRGALCESCRYAHSCSHIPIVEALPSERIYDANNNLECAIARPMIDFMVEQVRSSPAAQALVAQVLDKRSTSMARTTISELVS